MLVIKNPTTSCRARPPREPDPATIKLPKVGSLGPPCRTQTIYVRVRAGGTHKDYSLSETARHVAARGVFSQTLRRLGPAGSQTLRVME